MNLAIIGMAGNFKSAVAALVASQKKLMRLDCDEYIEYNFSMPIEQFVKKTNVTYFKKQVSKTVDELFDFVIFDSVDFADFVRRSEAVEEAEEGDGRFQSGKMSDQR